MRITKTHLGIGGAALAVALATCSLLKKGETDTGPAEPTVQVTRPKLRGDSQQVRDRVRKRLHTILEEEDDEKNRTIYDYPEEEEEIFRFGDDFPCADILNKTKVPMDVVLEAVKECEEDIPVDQLIAYKRGLTERAILREMLRFGGEDDYYDEEDAMIGSLADEFTEAGIDLDIGYHDFEWDDAQEITGDPFKDQGDVTWTPGHDFSYTHDGESYQVELSVILRAPSNESGDAYEPEFIATIYDDKSERVEQYRSSDSESLAKDLLDEVTGSNEQSDTANNK